MLCRCRCKTVFIKSEKKKDRAHGSHTLDFGELKYDASLTITSSTHAHAFRTNQMSQRQGEDLHQGTTSTSNAASTSRPTTPAASVTPTLVNVPPENSSSYTSWTLPSLDNVFSARRASAFGLRYSLAPTPTIASGKTSPAPSGMSIMMDSGPSGPSLLTKSRRSEYLSLHPCLPVLWGSNDLTLSFFLLVPQCQYTRQKR